MKNKGNFPNDFMVKKFNIKKKHGKYSLLMMRSYTRLFFFSVERNKLKYVISYYKKNCFEI